MSRATEIRKEIVEISEDYYKLPDESSWVLRNSMENEVEHLMQEYRELHVNTDIVSSGMTELLVSFAAEILRNEGFSSVEELQYFIYDGRPI